MSVWLGCLATTALVVVSMFAFAASSAVAAPKPSPSLAPVGVNSVGISTAAAGAPGAPPISVAPGGQFKGWFTFRNDLLVPIGGSYKVLGTVKIVDPGGTVLDSYHTGFFFPILVPTCSVPNAVMLGFPGPIVQGTATCSVTFNVPPSATPGAYKVRFSAQNFEAAEPNPFSFSDEKAGWLTVTGPALCVNPATLDFGDTGTTANLSITNCGTGGTLNWTITSSTGWLGAGTASGTNNGNSNITVNRTTLPGGNNSATLTVNSNAGAQSVAVTAVNNTVPTATPTVPGPTPTPSATVGPVIGGPGAFFPQTNFWVRDAVPCPGNPAIVANFMSEFNRLGGIATLGYPASRPYWKDGFCYQVFQRGILQWRVDYAPPQAVLANTMDWLNQAGKDEILFARGVPRHFTGNDGAGGNFELAKQIRFGWMTDQAIRDVYFANPSPGQIPDSVWDPVTFYGLPTSQPQSFGAFTTQRFQRYVFQKWIQAVPGMPPPGSVVGVLAGDLAKEMGLVPAEAMATETP